MTLDELVETFEFFDDWEDKYRFIIDLGKDLPALPDADKTDAHLIRGCQSQVWLTYKITEGKLAFNMDSDAHIVRGLIAVVLVAIQDRSAAEIQQLDIEGIFGQLDLLFIRYSRQWIASHGEPDQRSSAQPAGLVPANRLTL